MPQIKTRRLVRKGDIRDMHNYKSYINNYHHLDKPKTCNTNVEELNKNIKKTTFRPKLFVAIFGTHTKCNYVRSDNIK